MLTASRSLLPHLAKLNHGTQPTRRIGSCCVVPYFSATSHGDTAFHMRSTNVKYGVGLFNELGFDAGALAEQHVKRLGSERRAKLRVAVFTDERIKHVLPHYAQGLASLKAANLDVVAYEKVRVEPTSQSFMDAAAWISSEGPFDCFVSIGGGSVMDTCKAAILYSHRPPKEHGFLTYINKPVGEGMPVPETGSPLPPHIACPTTAGTGSECTGFAICKLLEHPTAPNSKTGIASPMLIPTLAVVDPSVTHSLAQPVVAASGFDVLAHAVESYTAKPYTRRAPASPKHMRPLNQGANPYSDMACIEALQIVGRYFERALTDDKDLEAREQMMWASCVVGTAMGNAGVHLPHGLSYPACGHVKHYHPGPGSGYPTHDPLLPHGMGVILCAPGAVRITAKACPDRHLNAARLLGANDKGIKQDDVGELLASQKARFPNGLNAVGFFLSDIPMLSEGCFQQKRVIDNAPLEVNEETVKTMYASSMKLW